MFWRPFELVIDPDPETIVSTGFAVMLPRPEIGTSLLTTVVGSTAFIEYLESVAQGRAYPAGSVKVMVHHQRHLPDLIAVSDFEAHTMRLRHWVAQAQRESTAFAALRDALHPELLSGRIRVSEARGTIEETIDEEVPHG